MTPFITSILPFLVLAILGVSGTPVDSYTAQSPSEVFYSRGWQLLKNLPPINVVTDLYQSLLNFRDKVENEITLIDVNQHVIHPNGDTSKCLSAAYNDNGVQVVLDDCTGGSNPPPSQLWTVTGGTFRIFGNKCLDNTNGVTTNGQTMQIYDCYPGSRNQQWTQTDGSIQLTGTNKCLDNTWGTNTGKPAQLWDCYDGSNQIWSVVPPSATTIRPGKSGTTCLAASFNTRDGAPVTVQPCNTDVHSGQKWTYSGGTLYMQGLYGHMCLDVPDGKIGDGVKMRTLPCNTRKEKANQQFVVSSSNQIIWKDHKECLDLTGGWVNPGNQVQMWNCSPGHPNQVWNFV